MLRLARGITTGLAIAAALAVTGCIASLTQNPSKFPYFAPAGDIIQSHAKPAGFGYFANFDPFACRLEVRPRMAAMRPGDSQVLIATVYDESGQPRRGRRVEWVLEGKGHILEVDEAGYHPGRGYKVNERYAVSYTAYKEHVFDRGNNDPTDDFVIRPGQTWCVITSPIEGDTYVTAYAPGIYNWDRYKVQVETHWVNVAWTFPAPLQCRGGGPCTLTTNVFRRSDGLPLSNYRVRYTVIDGPPAVFQATGARTDEAVTDVLGNGNVTLVQPQPAPGISRIGIEVIRPSDSPVGPGTIIGRGETAVEWTAPSLAVTKLAPPSVAIGHNFNCTITLTNNGAVESEPLTVRDRIPEGLTFVGSVPPPAGQEGADLVWTVPSVRPGVPDVITVTFRADRAGAFNNLVSVTGATTRLEAAAVTLAAEAGLSLSVTAPPTAFVGEAIPYRITLTNTGAAAASNVVVRSTFDRGLVHARSADKPVETDPFTLEAGRSFTTELVLTAQTEGLLNNRLSAVADGGLSDVADATVRVTQPRAQLRVTGPSARYVRGRVEWTISARNSQNVPLTDAIIRAQLPGEVTLLEASQGGLQEPGGVVLWNLGTLSPQQEVRLRVAARVEQVAPRALCRVSLTAQPGIQETAENACEFRGVPALLMEMTDTADPIRVGEQTTYQLRLTNTGSLVANGIEVVCTGSSELRILQADGPDGNRGQIEGNRIVFPPRDGLIPTTQLVYTIVVQGAAPGDGRFRVEVRSNLGPDPVIEEEPTTVLP
ncbi:MAG TPA: DUF11 domain-containing protein [Gemmatales bacterium]|nr:DUF11 domain-containing protein [Gemmatales bacterium]